MNDKDKLVRLETLLESLKEDLKYVLEREHFGAPKNCIPKSYIQQIYDAHYGNV